MVATTEREPSMGTLGPRPDGGGGGDPRDEPRPIRRIVVPVDGSPFAERALPVAAWVAGALDAPVHLVEVVDEDDGADGAIHYLDDLAHRHGAAQWDLVRDVHPGEAIVRAGGAVPSHLVCLATHGRDRSAAALGSVAMDVLQRAAAPVLLVGPGARPPCADDAPVVAALDGSPGDDVVVRVAAEWAGRLRRGLVVATVAEPVPSPFRRDRPVRRARGPADPEAYAARLAVIAAGAAPAGTHVDARVVYDPVSVRDGVVRLVDRTTALLVLGTHRRARPLRAVLGSHAARIVHDLEVPALVVPLDTGG